MYVRLNGLSNEDLLQLMGYPSTFQPTMKRRM